MSAYIVWVIVESRNTNLICKPENNYGELKRVKKSVMIQKSAIAIGDLGAIDERTIYTASVYRLE